MRKPTNSTRSFTLTLMLACLMSLHILPTHFSGQSAQAATEARPAESVARNVTNGRIAFTGRGNGSEPGIYAVNPDGGDLRRLTSGSQDLDADWSPDGRQIAFTKVDIYGYGSIYVMDADGSNQRQLTQSVRNSWNDQHPSWSPDGTKIAFTNFVFPGGGLYVMDADGSDRRRIGDFAFTKISWSPDGSRLVVANSGDGSLYLINGDGSNVLRITYELYGAVDQDPAWSPDGSRIAFTRWTVGNDCDFAVCNDSDIWVVNADGSNPTALTTDGSSSSPVWSPDGAKIAFNGGSDNNSGLYVMNADGGGVTGIYRSYSAAPSWQPLSVIATGTNPIDDTSFFVRQHYRDFLSREPDADGLAFWTDEINSCGGDAQCVEAARVNVSAAFFLSIEFQNTGYLVERMYKAAYGDATEATTGLVVPVVRRAELAADSATVGQGVIVNQAGWEQQLEANKQSYALAFVQRQRFTDAYPQDMAPADLVARLNQNTGGTLTQDEADALAAELSADSSAATRADVLRKVAEDSAFSNNEKNRAFVLMQYYGYLRRDPDAAPDRDYSGYQFWLDKLNSFGGDFVQAEMVKAFIESAEYRQRFGQQ
jgi:dipeptidyl aminopeptidase/acylaminoacyl peptidase